MPIRPENHFNELLAKHQLEIDESYRQKEAIDKRADELFQEALDDPMTLLQMDKDYDIIQDSLGKALRFSTAAKAGHIIHREELVKAINEIWKRLDDACLHKAGHEWVNY